MSHSLEFNSLPSAVGGFLRAAVARGSGLKKGQTIPRISAICRGVVADAEGLRKYRKLCGFRIDGRLPPSYPHILAAPLHLQVLTHKAFPFKLLGAVHVRNAVTQHRPIAASEALDVEVFVEGHRDVDAGREFDLVTKIRDTAGKVAWESTSTNLIRGGSGGKSKKSGWTPPDWSAFELVGDWTVPEDIGRRYGLIAGDVNPIHMHALAAKPFGFKRAIAHGMYSYARCVARLLPEDADAVSLTVAFKRPVFLPSRVELLARDDAKGREYLLTNAARDTVYLEGRIDRPQAAGSAPAAKKAVGKKAAAKKATAKKAAAKKSAAKKSARKATAKKATAKKATASKSAARKTAAKKTGA
ncbi:MaoC family dehydratase [Algiphilus aromaticivorans]|uniref:MaoC family dehydratase n=1 Tax=Algiphilus aromaticivorans TaxID=382454 RepID=UPI000694C423|nr:MaoC/PaaZ C-terminal domain-containing protein [Algiphilus aromaticivorans]